MRDRGAVHLRDRGEAGEAEGKPAARAIRRPGGCRAGRATVADRGTRPLQELGGSTPVNYDTLSSDAHQLKGSSANVGGGKMVQVCEDIRTACLAKNEGDMKAQLALLLEAAGELIAGFGQYLELAKPTIGE